MAKQKTKKEFLTEIKEIVKDYPELVIFCEKEIELLTKKNSKSNSKTAIENANILEILIQELANIAKPVTITELMNLSDVVANYKLESGDPLTNQKISAILNKVANTENSVVVKTQDKKKSLFSIIAE